MIHHYVTTKVVTVQQYIKQDPVFILKVQIKKQKLTYRKDRKTSYQNIKSD